MKYAVIYQSKSGNTEMLAKQILQPEYLQEQNIGKTIENGGK